MAAHRFHDDPELNIVLRGGPFDGMQLSGNARQPLAIRHGDGGMHSVYRPTDKVDREWPNLRVFVPATVQG